ncbi:uncharacterized protein V6R79_021046 [Siganus canaliculatus]
MNELGSRLLYDWIHLIWIFACNCLFQRKHKRKISFQTEARRMKSSSLKFYLMTTKRKEKVGLFFCVCASDENGCKRSDSQTREETFTDLTVTFLPCYALLHTQFPATVTRGPAPSGLTCVCTDFDC